MPYEVDLTPRVDDAPTEVAEDGRQEVMEVIAAALVRREAWPTPGWDGTLWSGPHSWVAFTAYTDDGIEMYDVGWAG
ncbi:hypothetical protein [Streptomyces sp. HD]|uniref:hypothetical protein n=1 Tax=Streptomyces sp. HD TaxID=3020892 RepID=UPI00232E29B3|nr:hypothetical protein [Streptomyces sp. HD]MDC0773906.1 hypothetical protein [Streptomyces sp. HD]